MKRNILVAASLAISILMLLPVAVFADTSSEDVDQVAIASSFSDLPYLNTEADTTGVVQYFVPEFSGANKVGAWNTFFGLGMNCVITRDDDGNRRAGGITLVHPKDAVVVKSNLGGFIVTQPAPGDHSWYWAPGGVTFSMRCTDQTPAPPAVHLEPYGSINGPCGNNRFWAKLDNAQSNRSTDFTVAYTNLNGVRVKDPYTVPANQITRTSNFSAMEGTWIHIYNHSAGEKIVSSRYVPVREWRGSCESHEVGTGYE